jgi:hypothetical protein
MYGVLSRRSSLGLHLAVVLASVMGSSVSAASIFNIASSSRHLDLDVKNRFRAIENRHGRPLGRQDYSQPSAAIKTRQYSHQNRRSSMNRTSEL